MPIGTDAHLERRRVGPGEPCVGEQFLGAVPGRCVQPDRGIHDRGGRDR